MRYLRLFILLFVLSVAGVGALAAKTVDYDGLRFTSLPDLPNRNYFGYNFVRVLITNSSGRERQIKLLMKVDYSRDLEEVSRSFTVQTGEVREETLLFPVCDFSSSGVIISVDGRELEDTLSQYFRTYRNFYAKKQALVDSRISKTDFESVFGSLGVLSSLNLELNQFDGNSSQLYRNWLGYSQFNLILYYSATLNEMPESVQRAIYDYVRAGGVLMVIGKTSLPDDFEKMAAAENAPWQVYEGGFGRVMFLGETFFPLAVEAGIAAASGTIQPDAALLSAGPGEIGNALNIEVFDLFADTSFKYDSPLQFDDKEIETVSARWLMLVIYLFAFLIGPVNIYVLYRMGRRILVFLTVPVASIICCAFIYGYYLAFESSTLIIKKQSLILLDERANRAITLANLSVYSAQSRPDGFHFDMQTEIFPVTRDDYRSSDAGKYLILDEDQHCRDGWIKPKVPRYLHLRAIQTRRERISLTFKDGKLELMNGLGADISEIHLMTRQGKIFKVENVVAGSSARMTEVPSVSANNKDTPPAIFSRRWFTSFDDLTKNQSHYLRPGTYVASLRQSPFLRQTVENGAKVFDQACVLGILKEDAGL